MIVRLPRGVYVSASMPIYTFVILFKLDRADVNTCTYEIALRIIIVHAFKFTTYGQLI
jgi:hypothetical protein